jgi:hypothetical protein
MFATPKLTRPLECSIQFNTAHTRHKEIEHNYLTEIDFACQSWKKSSIEMLQCARFLEFVFCGS